MTKNIYTNYSKIHQKINEWLKKYIQFAVEDNWMSKTYIQFTLKNNWMTKNIYTIYTRR